MNSIRIRILTGYRYVDLLVLLNIRCFVIVIWFVYKRHLNNTSKQAAEETDAGSVFDRDIVGRNEEISAIKSMHPNNVAKTATLQIWYINPIYTQKSRYFNNGDGILLCPEFPYSELIFIFIFQIHISDSNPRQTKFARTRAIQRKNVPPHLGAGLASDGTVLTRVTRHKCGGRKAHIMCANWVRSCVWP